ncbi:peptidase inhibitor family I36 protein [Streptosporangium sp. NPDC049248]|uniref:peptidase inhibitor family I36 protein n=1 Tax=Streptosporangium sp. NPDC049248 TaxID=3155651 RepID=UPI00344239DE
MYRGKTLISLLGLALLGGGGPAFAQAAPAGYERCPRQHFCLFDGAGGTGLMASFRHGSPDLRRQSMDDRASSYADRTTDTWWCLYENPNYDESSWPIYPGGSGNLSPEWDNRASSVKPCYR